ncbi:MAG: hypothetical protein Q4P24_17655 [Rhodobacterales bacterium]|nr:hypothetical protein [Rhodobacterales bacterium]
MASPPSNAMARPLARRHPLLFFEPFLLQHLFALFVLLLQLVPRTIFIVLDIYASIPAPAFARSL